MYIERKQQEVKIKGDSSFSESLTRIQAEAQWIKFKDIKTSDIISDQEIDAINKDVCPASNDSKGFLLLWKRIKKNTNQE